MIDVLPKERWHELKEILDREFDSELPNVDGAEIIADIADDGTVRSFLIAEHLLRIGQIYSQNGATRGLVRWILERMPADTSVITIASEPRFEKLYERFGMHHVPGTLFRRDF